MLDFLGPKAESHQGACRHSGRSCHHALQLRVALARACQTFAPYSRAAVRANLWAQHDGRPARYHCDSPLQNGLCGRMSRVRRPSVCGGDCGFVSQPPPPHIRKFAGLAKAQRLKRGERGKLAATHRRRDGFGRIPVNQACARSGWPGPGSAQSKNVHGSRLRLRCIPIALPREIGLRLANACRGLLSGNSSGALGPLVIGSADPILCVAPWFDGRSRSV